MNEASQQDREQQTILVVEDDLALLKLIRKRLEEQGYQTEGAASGETAVRWLQENSAQLMLLDYSLPDMTGEELLERLAAEDLQLPFVVATGHGSEALAVEMMKRGARDYLIKGASFLKLLSTVVAQTFVQIEQERRLARAEEELRQAHAELEGRVRQRTAELADANVRLRVEMNERRHAEELTRRHQAELAHVARLSTVGEMVAELTHELNQPLSAISNHALACSQLLQDPQRNSTEKLLDSMARIGEQSERAAAIIRRLRRFVTKTQPDQSTLDLNVLIRDIVSLVEYEARIAQVEIRFELADSIPAVAGDRIQIEQVLVNLFRNAFEAMRESDSGPRELTVRTSAQNAQGVEVSVCDTGVGIAEENIQRVFDRFYTTKPNGMGMGLPISRSIVESHGGRLDIEPNSDRGVTFRFTLPVHYGQVSG